VPLAQFVHTRLVDAVSSVATYVPGAQSPNSLQTRSLLAVAAVMTYLPAVQALLTAAQAPTPDALLYVWPTTHAAHWRSALALPTADRPWPMAHSCQVAHNALLAVALN